MLPRPFYNRGKIRLGDTRAVRREMARAYHACVRRELDWADYTKAIYGLSKLAELVQAEILEERLGAIERAVSAGGGQPPRLRVIEGRAE